MGRLWRLGRLGLGLVLLSGSAVACNGNHLCRYDRAGHCAVRLEALPFDVLLCAVFANNGVRCWGGRGDGSDVAHGYGNFDTIGDQANEVATLPYLTMPNTGTVVTMSLGRRQTCVVLQGSGVYCWGVSGHGLGRSMMDGDIMDASQAILSDRHPSLTDTVDVCGVQSSSCELTDSGRRTISTYTTDGLARETFLINEIELSFEKLVAFVVLQWYAMNSSTLPPAIKETEDGKGWENQDDRTKNDAQPLFVFNEI